MRRLARTLPWLSLTASGALSLAIGCGGFTPPAPQSASAVTTPAAYGTLSVSLMGDGAAPELSQLKLQLRGMAMEVGGAWRAVPLDALAPPSEVNAPPVSSQALDLLGLTSASPAVLATGIAWPEGLNTRFRLLLAPGGSVTTASDGQTHDLEAATVLEATMGLPGGFNVVAGTATNMMIVVNVANAALPDPATPTAYTFQPLAVRGYDRAATGSMKGTVTALAADPGGESVPLAGATVTAQLVEPLSAGGAGVAFRTAVTDASGQYTLDLLPLGYTWCGVSLPVVATQAYGAGAGTGVSLGYPPFNTGISDLAVSLAATTGTVTGTLSGPAAPGELDLVDLVETFAPGDTSFTVTLQSALVAGGQFRFPAVPPGTYAAVLNRFTGGSGTGFSHQQTLASPFTVEGGKTTTLPF